MCPRHLTRVGKQRIFARSFGRLHIRPETYRKMLKMERRPEGGNYKRGSMELRAVLRIGTCVPLDIFIEIRRSMPSIGDCGITVTFQHFSDGRSDAAILHDGSRFARRTFRGFRCYKHCAFRGRGGFAFLDGDLFRRSFFAWRAFLSGGWVEDRIRRSAIPQFSRDKTTRREMRAILGATRRRSSGRRIARTANHVQTTGVIGEKGGSRGWC